MSQSRVIIIEDGDGHGQYTTSPQSAEPSMPITYPGQSWSQAGRYAGQLNHRPDRLPSFSVFLKCEGQKQDYGFPQQHYRPQPPPTMSQQQRPPRGPPPPLPPQAAPQWPPAPPPQHQQEYRQQYPAQIETSSHPPPPVHHQRISSTYEPAENEIFFKEDLEKSKMLRGQNFDYFDPTLTNERQRCEAALQRYNDASSLHLDLRHRTTLAAAMQHEWLKDDDQRFKMRKRARTSSTTSPVEPASKRR